MLIRLVSPTGATKNRPIANASDTSTVPNQTPPEIARLGLRLVLDRDLRVGGDPERLHPDRQRADERDDAADHGQPVEAPPLDRSSPPRS